MTFSSGRHYDRRLNHKRDTAGPLHETKESNTHPGVSRVVKDRKHNLMAPFTSPSQSRPDSVHPVTRPRGVRLGRSRGHPILPTKSPMTPL